MTHIRKTNETLPVPRRVRGTLVASGDDRYEFVPQQQGEPQFEEMARSGEGRLKRSTGKQPKLVAHLTCRADDEQAATTLQRQLDELMTDLRRDCPTMAPPAGRTLMQDADLNIKWNQKRRTISVRFDIDLSDQMDYTGRLLKLMTRINQCFVTNQTTFLPQSR